MTADLHNMAPRISCQIPPFFLAQVMKKKMALRLQEFLNLCQPVVPFGVVLHVFSRAPAAAAPFERPCALRTSAVHSDTLVMLEEEEEEEIAV